MKHSEQARENPLDSDAASQTSAPVDGVYSTNDVLCLLSLTFFWAWIFLVFFSDISVMPLVGEWSTAGLVLKGCAMFGQAFFFLVIYLRKGAFPFGGTPKRRLLVSASSGSLLSVSALAMRFGLPVPLPVVMVCWFLMGLGVVYLLVQLGESFEGLNAKTRVLAVAAATMVAGLGFGVTINLQEDFSLVVTLLVFLLSVLFVHLSSSSRTVSEPKIERPASVFSELKTFLTNFFFFSYVFGMVLSLGVTLTIAYDLTFVLCLAICLASIFLILNVVFLYDRFGIERVLWVLLPLVSLGLLPLPFVDSTGRIVCCVLLIAGFTAYDMLSIPLMKSLGDAAGAPIEHFHVRARLVNASGVFLGWVTGAFFYRSGLFYEDIFTAYSLALIILLVLLITFLDKPARAAARRPNEELAVLEQAPKWIDVCDEIGDRFSLSPREKEVFLFLAKGRDVGHISETLHISPYTARSHIYHIYSKCNIHNKQELIDYVERCRRSKT